MNLLATLMLSQGTPMLLAGDEIGHSQGGNNNAYCQDNPPTWIDWAARDAALLAFTCRLLAFRRAHPVLRQSRFLHGRARATGGLPDVSWRRFDGGAVNWRDPGLAGFCVVLRGSAEAPEYAATDDAVMLAVNGGDAPEAAVLPDPGPGQVWRREIDTAAPGAPAIPCVNGMPQPVAPHSVVAFALVGAA